MAVLIPPDVKQPRLAVEYVDLAEKVTMHVLYHMRPPDATQECKQASVVSDHLSVPATLTAQAVLSADYFAVAPSLGNAVLSASSPPALCSGI